MISNPLLPSLWVHVESYYCCYCCFLQDASWCIGYYHPGNALFLLHMSHDPSMCAATNTARIKLFQFKNKTWTILVSIPYMLVWLHKVMKLWKYVLAMYSFLLQKKLYSVGYSFANVTQAGNICWSGNKARNYNTVELVYVWFKHLRIYFLQPWRSRASRLLHVRPANYQTLCGAAVFSIHIVSAACPKSTLCI